MKVKELIDQLQRQCKSVRGAEDFELVIPIKTIFPTIGPKPVTNVTHVHAGIDWDKGKVFLYPDKNLVAVDKTIEDEIKNVRKEMDELAWENMQLRRGKK